MENMDKARSPSPSGSINPMIPTIQHAAAEVCHEGESILNTELSLDKGTPAAELMHSYAQMQSAIGDARVEMVFYLQLSTTFYLLEQCDHPRIFGTFLCI